MAVVFQVLRKTCPVVFVFLIAGSLISVAAQNPDRAREAKIAAARTLFDEAAKLSARGDKESRVASIAKFAAAEKVFEEFALYEDLCASLSMHGSMLVLTGSEQEAGDVLNRGLAACKSADSPAGQATVLLVLGAYSYKVGDMAKARTYLEEARVQIEKQPLQSLDLQIYQLLGNVYIAQRDRTKATEVLWKAYETAKDRSPEEAISTLRNYALAQVKLDTPKYAVEFYEIALQRARAAKLATLEVEILNELGSIFTNRLNDPVKGKEYLDQALTKADSVGSDEGTKALILFNYGYALYLSFRMQEALTYYERALAIAQKYGYSGYEATILYNTGLVYASLNDPKRAIELYNRSIKIAREIGDRETELYARANLANANVANGDPEAAAKNYVEAVAVGSELVKKGGPHFGLRIFAIKLLIEFGNFALKGRDNDLAMEIYTAALEKAREWELNDSEATLINNIGKVHEIRGDDAKALPLYNSSLALSRAVGARLVEVATLENLMGVWERSGNRNFAVFYGKSAVNIYQDFRKGLQGLSVDDQRGFLQRIESTYRKLASLLIRQGRIAEAEQVLTMLKEEELLDYVRRDDGVASGLLETIALTDDERAAVTRYQAIAGQLTTLGKEFGDLETERKASTGPFPKQKRYDELKQQLADATLVFEKFLEELKLKFGQRDERVVQIDSSLKRTLERLKANRTAVISTIVGEDTLNIIVTTSRTQRAHTIKKSAAEINDLVAKFHAALKSPQYDPRPLGQELYDLILKPVEEDLAGIKADTLVWSLDGTLRYIPPAALWDKKNGYVAERFANVIVNLASRDTLALDAKSGQKLSVLGVGVSKPVETFSALTAVPDELDCIVSDKLAGILSPKPQCRSGVLKGRKLLDDSFTLANFEGEIGRYPIIHIASHFKLTPGDDKNSFLLLGGGTDRRFTVERLRGEPLTDVELIVLSACNTATPGGAKTNGIEIEGFGSIAQKEGAKSVMATLWSVADSSTKDFMVEFYRLYGNGGMSKADAMRQAQLRLMNGKYSADDAAKKHRAETFGQASGAGLPPFKTDPNAPFAHPFYWSPFILIGNWR